MQAAGWEIRTRGPYQERLPIAAALEVGHDAVDNVRQRREYVHDIHVLVHGAAVRNDLDVWSSVRLLAWRGQRGERAVLVMFSFRISSSLTTLSMSLRLASSTTSTFHCVFHEGSDGGAGKRGGETNFSASCIADSVEDDCARRLASCSAVDCVGAGLELTFALRVNNGDAHGGQRWALAALLGAL